MKRRLAPPARAAVRPDHSSTRPPPCCTTARRSSRGSRPTGTRTARSGTFRPEAERRAHAALGRRLALPELPIEYFIESLRAAHRRRRRVGAVRAETSLYLRPFMFAKEAFLGVRPAKKVNYYVIASPRAPTSTAASPGVDLAHRGLRARRQGRHGRGQDRRQLRIAACCRSRRRTSTGAPRWCSSTEDGRRRGARRHEHRVRLQGRHARHAGVRSILEGITRDSILQLAPRPRPQGRGARRCRSTSGARAWSPATSSRCSRAARPRSITPIGAAQGGRTSHRTSSRAGELAMSLREELTDIQYGRVEDRHGWLLRLDA